MTGIELLNRVLGVFDLYKDNSKILDYLLENNILHASFEEKYILNQVDFQFTKTHIDFKDDNLMLVFLEASDGSPYRAEIIFDGNWYLRSFLFQCQSCFGNDANCDVCGGSGWGVL